MNGYKEFVEKINRFFASLSAIALLIIMFAINIDVFGRTLFNRPIYGTIGLTRTLLVILIFSSIGYAQVKKTHIQVEVVINKFSEIPRKITLVLGLVFSFVIMTLMTYGTTISAYKSFLIRETMSGIVRFPIWPGRFIVAFGCMMLILQYPVDIKENIGKLYKDN